MPFASPMEANATAVIHHVMKRSPVLPRQAAGKRTEQQVIAANVDYVGIVAGIDREFNPRRIERYMTLAHNSGAEPLIVLNKADLIEDPQEFIQEAELSAPQPPGRWILILTIIYYTRNTRGSACSTCGDGAHEGNTYSQQPGIRLSPLYGNRPRWRTPLPGP
jgi:hypothetical protein